MLKITAVPAFADNYIWVLQSASHAVVVDPGQAEPVLDFLAQSAPSAGRMPISAVLLTHSHADHWAGVAGLQAVLPASMPVYGPAAMSVVTHPVSAGEVLFLLGQRIEVLPLPGHTDEQLGFLLHDTAQRKHLFCGDAIFASGCGRVYGRYEDAWHSLQTMTHLAPDTLIYPAHEYSLSNLAFAVAVEPQSSALRQRQQAMQCLRDQGQPTLPVTLASELECNPFLRAHVPEVKQAVQAQGYAVDDTYQIFCGLRQWKNRF